MTRSQLFVFLFYTITFHPINCMLSEFKYEPCVQLSDSETIDSRNRIFQWIGSHATVDLGEVKRDIKIIRSVKKNERTWKCTEYAMKQVTGSTAPISIYIDKTSNLDIEKFFDQTENPRPQDLVIYTNSKDDREIKHFAVVIQPTIFESKFGAFTKIIQHKLFAIPLSYGNAASFWTLKKEFTTLEGKKLLQITIEEDIEFFNKYPFYAVFSTQLLISYAAIGIGLGKVLSELCL
jgi:hypothetical protein